MALLPDIRKVFRRRNRWPVEIDLSSPGDPAAGGAGAVADEARPAPRPLVTVEPKPATTGRSRSVAELERSYEQVMVLVRKIGDHLDAQASRQDHVDEVIGQVPAALDVLPEISRQNSRLLDLLGEHLDQSRQRESTLNQTLVRLSESSSQQSAVLSLLQQQLEANNHASQQMTNALSGFRETLNELSQSNARAIDVLSAMATASEHRESRLETLLTQTQKWMVAAFICFGMASIVALILAAVTLLRG